MNSPKKALALAKKYHKGQFRRDGVTPYLEHVKTVRAKIKGDPFKECVALLHDTLEDTKITVDELKKFFHPNIVSAIITLTKIDGEKYDDYLNRVKQNPLATEIKIADILSNLEDDPTEKQIKTYTKGLETLGFSQNNS